MTELNPLARRIWEEKYRDREAAIEDSWARISRALAHAYPGWEEEFYRVLAGFSFLPGGRIQAGAGTGRKVTLFNCFVMGEIEDSIPGIFEALKEGALTMQEGGGVGYDFSTLRPAGSIAKESGMTASGPVSFMKIWDSMCSTILSTGARRGAMMATLRADHPDIMEFVEAKRSGEALRHFNLSVLAGDDFMAAVKENAEWPLVFPDAAGTVMKKWPGAPQAVPCRVHRVVPARALWDEIMKAAYDSAEPGVIFIDRVRNLDNLSYCEEISATNPCGEIPLPPYGACDLGSLNLVNFVSDPFTSTAAFDFASLERCAKIATRMLDAVYDISRFPLPAQREEALKSRRIGLGITGLADALIMLGLPYDSDEARDVAGKFMETVCHAAYRTSIELAREKGAFPLFDAGEYCKSPFVRNLPADIRENIEKFGIRNSHLTAIAPAGTISLLANNVSSGLEPVYALEYERRLRNADGTLSAMEIRDYAYDLYRRKMRFPLPAAFRTAHEISPLAQLKMQMVLQRKVDNAISKTINIPESFDFGEFSKVYLQAHELGLKGCTAFRPNRVTGQVLRSREADKHCCTVEREAD